MSPSERNGFKAAHTIWVTCWGELTEQDVPSDLWARMLALKRRKDGQVDCRGGKRLTDVLRALDEIAIARYNDAA